MQRSKKLAAALAVVGMLLGPAAQAETIFTCSEPEGYQFFKEGPFVPKEKSGWSKSKINGGQFSFVINGTNQDLLYKDATGKIYSSVSEGAKVGLLTSNDTNAIVIVRYETGNTEIYNYDAIAKVLLWSQHKVGGIIQSASLMKAKCD